MEYLGNLAADAARLRDAAGRDLTAAVPGCPDWTAADLVQHVGGVYLHKAECMRRNARPDPWPPPGLDDEEPLALFDRGYAALVGEFGARTPETPAWTWYPPEQTVGFWLRRMAQETVIHRVDAEQAAGLPVTAIPADLAEDGVDEVLERFLAFGSREWSEDFEDLLPKCDGRSVRIVAGDRSWLVRLTTGGVDLSTDGDPAAEVSAAPEPMLLWLWRRAGDEVIAIDGDRALVAQLRELLGAATL